jgi:hypothetical protein
MLRNVRFSRAVALAIATVTGVFSAIDVFVFANIYNYTTRHFPLFVTKQDFVGAILTGILFGCSLATYIWLVRKTRDPIRDKNV